MGFKVISAREQTQVANTDIIATEDLYFDDAGKVVGAGSNAVSLLVREGRIVPRKYEELVTKGGKPKAAKKAAPKAANKSRKGSSDK